MNRDYGHHAGATDILRYNTDNNTTELVIYGARQFGIKTRRSRHFGNLSYGGLHEEVVRPT